MHKKRTHVVFLLVFLVSLLAEVSHSQISLAEPVKPQEEEPIEISSERMRSENGGQKIIFSGNVVARWGELEIISDILEIYNSKDSNQTDEIIAIGHVTITRGDRKAKGDRAIYLDKAQKIILTGTPKAIAWEGKTVIEGREMIFLLNSDRFVVNERVRMKIYPKEKSPGQSEKKSKITPTGKLLSRNK